MSRAIELRRAAREHFEFALALYLSAMRPYTQALMVWDEGKQRESFAAQWALDEVHIIAVDEREVGWLQICDAPGEIRLLQFFIAPERQRNGIGTEVLHELQEAWRKIGKPVELTVLKNNPARHLYERAGFAITGEQGVKFTMRWVP